jgi:DnaK suppressor protein
MNYNFKTMNEKKISRRKCPFHLIDGQTSYSREQLLYFERIIDEEREKAQFDYELHNGLVSNSEGNGTEDTSPTHKILEEGQKTISNENNSALRHRAYLKIKKCDAAKILISNGTYGIQPDGEIIDPERLRANPFATSNCSKES